jgi:hypothetical protein
MMTRLPGARPVLALRRLVTRPGVVWRGAKGADAIEGPACNGYRMCPQRQAACPAGQCSAVETSARPLPAACGFDRKSSLLRMWRDNSARVGSIQDFFRHWLSSAKNMALSQSCLLEAKSENAGLKNQQLARINFPVFGDLRQSCHARGGTTIHVNGDCRRKFTRQPPFLLSPNKRAFPTTSRPVTSFGISFTRTEAPPSTVARH